jgi:hypothetical protein
MSIKLIKQSLGRKRFIKTGPIASWDHWQTDLNLLKSFLIKETALQIVTGRVYFELSQNGTNPKMMLEVIGLPVEFLENSMVLEDHENRVVLVHPLTGLDLFSLDFDQLEKRAFDLKEALAASFAKQEDQLSEIFHIVFDHDKIELHFFSQKDYIQK